MDIATHALSSFALARGLFPRRGWPVAVGMVVAGTIADADAASALAGPSAYLTWRGTYLHSFPGAALVIAIASFVAIRLGAKKTQTLANIAIAAAAAAILHMLLDLVSSEGIVLLWPLKGTRFAADLLPGVDPWILTLLILGLVTPELFRLVSSEIGAKDKTPRGRNGAVIVLSLILIYVGARYALHASALVELDAHAYRGESPRRVGAFADTLSIFTWHAIVDTQSQVCELEAPVGPSGTFDPEAASCQHKPEASPALDAAQQSQTARKFLQSTRFPKATVEKTSDGYEVSIRALKDVAEQSSWHRVAAQIILDDQPHVLHEQLVWSSDLHMR